MTSAEIELIERILKDVSDRVLLNTLVLDSVLEELIEIDLISKEKIEERITARTEELKTLFTNEPGSDWDSDITIPNMVYYGPKGTA
jgi:hypothetical protein